MPGEIADFSTPSPLCPPPVFTLNQTEKSLVLRAEVTEPYSQLWASVVSTSGFLYKLFFFVVGNM